MALERKKEIASRFVESIGTGTIDHNDFANDFSAWTASSGNVAGAEYRRRAKLVKMCTKLGVLPLKVIGLTAEGDRVAVQAQADAELTDGQQYHNDYHFLVIFREEKISFVYEYMNPRDALGMLLPLIRAMA